jgi:hypothetical protein
MAFATRDTVPAALRAAPAAHDFHFCLGIPRATQLLQISFTAILLQNLD